VICAFLVFQQSPNPERGRVQTLVSLLCFSVCLTSLTPYTFNGCEIWFLHVFNLLLVSSILILLFRFPFLFLKCLLPPRLALVKLSTLVWFWSSNHCILACFLWPKNCYHPSSNHVCFRSYRPRLSLAGILVFSLIFPLGLFMSSLSFKFSKAENLYWDFNLILFPHFHLT
jgi:hypothetical protein